MDRMDLMDLMDGMDGMDGMDSEPRSAAAAVGDWRERGDREALQLRWALGVNKNIAMGVAGTSADREARDVNPKPPVSFRIPLGP